MKLIYLTSKEYPSSFADNFFALEMARAFDKLLPGRFIFVVGYEDPGYSLLEGLTHRSPGVRVTRGKRVFYFFWLPYFILKNGFSEKDNVFFSNDENLLAYLIFWKKVLCLKYRIISDWHMLNGKRDRFIAEKSDGLITTTKHLKQIIVDRLCVSPEKILAAYGGVDLGLFEGVHETEKELRARFHLPEDSFLVGYMGFYKTMGMSKGIDTMIEALALISDLKVCMVFVGGRPGEIKEYREYAKKNGVEGRTFFVPAVLTAELALYEKAVDMLVIPYPDKPHFREYGFPMKTYEYLAAKKPILFSALPIIAEVLSDCATPFIPGDASDLAKKILTIKDQPSSVGEKVVRGYEKTTQCTWRKRAEKIVLFIESLVL